MSTILPNEYFISHWMKSKKVKPLLTWPTSPKSQHAVLQVDNQNHTGSQDMSGSLLSRASQVVPVVKNLLLVQETWEMPVWSLSWEDPLEWEMAICSSILAWKTPWTKEPGRVESMRLQRVRHDWICAQTHTNTHTHSSSPLVFPHGFPSLKPTALYTGCTNSAFNFNVNVSSLERTLWPPYLTLHGTLLLPLQHSLQSNLQSSSLSVLFTPGSGQ